MVLGALSILEDEITTLAAHLTAASCRFLQLIAEFDRREGWGGIGMRSCAHWLSWKCGIDLVTAREKVRIARALENLPEISEAMKSGTLSYSKVKAMTRVATPANEHSLLVIALNGTASHVVRVCQLYRRVARAQENSVAVTQHRNRELSYYWDEDGCLVIKGRLPADQGALVVKALEEADRALQADARGEGKPATNAPAGAWVARQADALTLVAERMLTGDRERATGGDRHLVTVHVNVEALASQDASAANDNDVRCHAHDGPALAREVVRRFACDASVVAVLENARGDVLDIGRKTRAIPPALRRALAMRDHGCRFPGCSNTRFVDAHHVKHWADGGETKIDNLVLLCDAHHRQVHEGGCAIEMRAGEVIVRHPNGWVLPAVPVQRPVRESDAVLMRANSERGIEIDARTGIPGWGGERADYAYLVELVARRDQLAEAN